MKSCPRCTTPVGDDGVCAACLLPSLTGGEDRPKAERIFQAALALDEAERVAFIEKAASGDGAVLEEALLLLEGYAEAGGDAAEGTLGGAARSQWAMVRKEEPGTVIDHFRLIRIIGEGGMGSVWEAEQSVPFKRRVALKIIKLGMDTEEVVRRFERERRTLALMTHPHIAQVFEAGSTPAGRPYFAMELVEGIAITTHSVRENLAVAERLGLFLQVCAAVEHAHQKGIIHRDLKPSNILVAADGVKVIDFGVAKATLDEGGDGLVTRQQQVLGTPAYMSPEQADSNGADVDTRTDVYSLGAVLYELISGQLPHDPQRLVSTGVREMQRILREEDPSLLKVDRTDQTDLRHITHMALRKERDRRYPSAAAFAADVQRFLNGEAVSAVPPTLAYRFGKFVKRNKAAVAAMTGIILALTAGLIVSLRQVKLTNEALASADAAKTNATLTLADMFTRSGIAAGESNDPTRAALWFANAAIIGEADPARVESNRLRAEAWRREAPSTASVLDTGYLFIRDLKWHPRLPALIAHRRDYTHSDQPACTVWNLEGDALWRPDLGFHSCAWSPTGEWIAAVLPGDVLAVLEYPAGREVGRFPCTPGDPVWSHDGRWIALGDQLLDWRTRETRRLPGAGTVSFSRDGRRLLLHMGAQAGVCSMEAPETFLHQPVEAHPLDKPVFLDQGQRYVVTSKSGALRVHDATTGAVLETIPGHGAATTPLLTASPDGRFVVRESVPLLDLETKQFLGFPIHKAVFTAFAFSPDGRRLASGGYDRRMELWSLPDGKFLGPVGHHNEAVISADFSPDGRYLASAESGIIRVWDTRPPPQPREIPAGGDTLAALSPDGTLVMPSGYTNRASIIKHTRVCRLPSGEPAGPEISPGGILMDAIFSRDNAWIALAVATTADRSDPAYQNNGGTGNIQFWNPLTGTRLGEPVPVPSEPRGLCLHPDGEWLGVYCSGEGLEIHTTTRQIRPCFKNQRFSPAGGTLANGRCAYSPDGRVFAAWGGPGSLHLWDRSAGRDLITPFPPSPAGKDIFDVALTNETAAIAVLSAVTRLEFVDLHSGKPSAPEIHVNGWPFRTQFSPDGKLLLSAGGSNAGQIWDWRCGQLVCPALPHDDAIMAGTFIPGTPWVITGGTDGQIKFWDRRTGIMIRPPLQKSSFVLGLQLTPDARTLVVTGYLGGRIELYDLAELLAAPDLDPQHLKLRAEIDAAAEVHPSGGLAPLTAQAWLAKWRKLRAAERAAPVTRKAQEQQ